MRWCLPTSALENPGLITTRSHFLQIRILASLGLLTGSSLLPDRTESLQSLSFLPLQESENACNSMAGIGGRQTCAWTMDVLLISPVPLGMLLNLWTSSVNPRVVLTIAENNDDLRKSYQIYCSWEWLTQELWERRLRNGRLLWRLGPQLNLGLCWIQAKGVECTHLDSCNSAIYEFW